MPTATINGIDINYVTNGAGPALLLLAPGGFDSTIEKWSTAGVWPHVRPIETLADRFNVIAYDRRESGSSGGRVEQLSWEVYADEAKALLDHLGIDRAFVMGGCMGCSVAIAFGTRHPGATRGLILHWPVGGAEWTQITHDRWLGVHSGFARENGLKGVVEVAREKKSFMADFRGGPWASVIANDPEFAARFATQDVDTYLKLIETITKKMYDRDTAPGAEPEDLRKITAPTLIIPGDDPAHATSAALYLKELIPGAEYLEGPVAEQSGERVKGAIEDFLIRHSAS